MHAGSMTTSTITVSRAVPRPPDEVFAAWVEADRLAAWWWPLAATTYDVDARPGGRFRIQSPAIGATVSGTYTDVDRPHRLAFTWVWQDDGRPPSSEDTVVVTFEPEDDATRVTVAHTSAEHAPDGGAEQGWSDVMERLGQSTSSRS
jgi:uncharacterized protein YndB with AHSA1/START domain